MTRLVLVAALALVACGRAPYCERGERYVHARTDTTTFPLIWPSGDTVPATVIVVWTAGCAPVGITEP